MIKPEHFHSIEETKLIGWVLIVILSGIILIAGLAGEQRRNIQKCNENQEMIYINGECVKREIK